MIAEPSEVQARQKAEIAALRKVQHAERKILNILGGLQIPDAVRIANSVAASVNKVADMSEGTRA